MLRANRSGSGWLPCVDGGRDRPGEGKEVSYRSPYSVQFTFSPNELLGDLEHGARGDPHLESSVPFSEWYSRPIRERYGAWGPPARHYPPPEGLTRRSAQWRRERVI